MANTIQGTFGLDINPLRAAANAALSVGRRLGGAFASVVSGPLARLGVLFASIGGTAVFAHGLKGAYDMGGAMNDLALRTRASVDALVILGQQFEDNGVEASRMGAVFDSMQRHLKSKEGQRALSELGLRFRELRRLSPDLEFVQVGRAINKIEDPLRRVAAAQALFGKSGGDLLTLFADPDFGKGNENLQRQAKLLKENADIFDAISDRLGRAGNVLRGFFLGAAKGFASGLLPVLSKLESLDLVGIGEKFATALMTAGSVFLGIFADPGGALQAWMSGWKLVIANVVALLARGLRTAGQFLVEKFNAAGEMLRPVGKLMEGMALKFTGALLAGMGRMLNAVSLMGERMQAAMIYAGEQAMEFIGGGWTKVVDQLGADLVRTFAVASVELANGLARGLSQVWENAKGFWAGIMRGIAKLPGIAKETKQSLETAMDNVSSMPVKIATAGTAVATSGFKGRGFDEILKGVQARGGAMRNWGNTLQASGDALSASGDMMANAAGREFAAMADTAGREIARIGPLMAKQLDESMEAMKRIFAGDVSSWRADFSAAMQRLQAAGQAVMSRATAIAPAAGPAGYAAFANFRTASMGSSLSSGGLTTGGLASGSLSGGGGLGHAYGLVKRGDATRKKDPAEGDATTHAVNKLSAKMDDYWGRR